MIFVAKILKRVFYSTECNDVIESIYLKINTIYPHTFTRSLFLGFYSLLFCTRYLFKNNLSVIIRFLSRMSRRRISKEISQKS